MAVHQICCDESCTTGGHRSLIVSGTMVEAGIAADLNARMDAWRARENMLAEMKWTKISAAKFEKYLAIVEAAFRRIACAEIAFRSVVFQSKDIRYGEFHDGSQDLGLYRFMYQMILHCHVPRAAPGDSLIVLPDKRNLKDHQLGDLQRALNHGIRKEHGFQRNTVVSIEPLDSKTSNLSQVNDILMGAVAFFNNDRDRYAGGNQAKRKIAARVAELAQADLRSNTPASMKHFGVWQFCFGAGRKAGARKKHPET